MNGTFDLFDAMCKQHNSTAMNPLLNGAKMVTLKVHVMAYLHCRIHTWIPTRIQTRLQTQWLHCTMQKFSHCTELDSDSNPNSQLQEWDHNRSPSPSM